MWKKIFYVILIVAAGIIIWFLFAIWIGLYSVYSIPPSKEDPNGATLIIHRDEWEPIFNSPDYVAPKRNEESQGMGWSKPMKIAKRPLPLRTIIKLPFIDWAYQKSLPEGEREKKKK